MKYLKKIALLVLLLPTIVLADNYELKEVNATITIPNDWMVFTKDNIKGNKTLKELNVTEDYMNEFFEKNSAYLDAMPKDLSYEFVLRTQEVDQMNNLSNYKDSEVEEVGKEFGKIVNSNDNSIYKTKYKYVESYYYDSTNKMYIASYYTVVNRLGYTFTAQKSTNFTSDEKEEIKGIINTITYKILPEYKDEEKTSFNNPSVIICAIIGGLTGGLVVYLNNKKKKNQANN